MRVINERRETLSTEKGDIEIRAQYIEEHGCTAGSRISVDAYHASKSIGFASFFFTNEQRENIIADGDPGVFVEPEWRRHHIATRMYLVAEQFGFEIIPSSDRTEDGDALWSSFRLADPNSKA